MEAERHSTSTSKGKLWTGRVMSWLFGAWLMIGAVMNLLKPAFIVEGTAQLGYQENVIIPFGIVLLLCTLLYLIPPTAILGAILLNGWLGRAVASHVRAGQGPVEILIPVIFGCLLWGGLYLRDEWLRALIPVRR